MEEEGGELGRLTLNAVSGCHDQKLIASFPLVNWFQQEKSEMMEECKRVWREQETRQKQVGDENKRLRMK
jgi:hypothetical protein